MHPTFANALNPPQFAVLGLRLESLTVGHCVLLHRIGSPFMVGGITAPADLSDAVYICARRWDVAERDTQRWCFKYWLMWWGWVNRKRDLCVEIQKIKKYFEIHTALPPMSQKIGHGRGRGLGAPDVIRLLAMLMGEFNMSEREALNYPVLRANALWIAMAEYQGKVDVTDEHDLEFARFCEEMDKLAEPN